MDVRKPRHDLQKFKAAMRRQLAATRAALEGAAALGLEPEEIQPFLETIERRHFVKSTTSNANHRQWQDVYNTPLDDKMVYVKFTDSVLTAFLLLSLKEK
jgi:motility quorum-sensing regulator / GCU-specific mRNA interferase toxin